MAKKNRSNRPRSRARRVYHTIPRVTLSPLVMPRPFFRPRQIPVPSPRRRVRTRYQGDMRRYHPYKSGRPYTSLSGRSVYPRMVISDDLRVSRKLDRDALVCVRRSQRREVLFAKGRSGRTRRARRKSDVRCK